MNLVEPITSKAKTGIWGLDDILSGGFSRGHVFLVEGAPGTGKLDFEALFGQLAAQGYAGRIGCEYKPSDPADSSTSFGWREPDEV